MKTTMNNVVPAISKYFPYFISGFLLVLSFPTLNLSFLAWIALVPFFYFIRGSNNITSSFKSGLIMGTTFFFGTQYWIYHSINHYGKIPFIPSISIVLLLCVYQGIYSGIFGLLVRLSYRRIKIPLSLIAPALWVSLEYLRGILFTGFPWSLLGYSQFQFLPLIQVADITGIYGISFLIVYANALLAELFIQFFKSKERKLPDSKRRTQDSKLIFLSLIFFIILITGSMIYGYKRIENIRKRDTITVSIVQGNIEQDKKWEPEYQDEVIKIYKKLSKDTLKNHPQLIVWPETALPFFFGGNTRHTDDLIRFQKTLNVFLLSGSVIVRDFKDNKYQLTNSAILLSPDGKNTYTYDKIHLVPFGEYVPLKKILFFIDKLVVGIGDFIHGDSLTIAKTPIGRFAALICYEIIFPELVRKFYTSGGDFIITITNDAWFGRTTGPYQHFAISVFRAIENRKPIVRAANTGISGFIESNGMIIQRTKLFERTTITQEIHKNSDITFYTMYGNVFTHGCNVLSLFVLLTLLKTIIPQRHQSTTIQMPEGR